MNMLVIDLFFSYIPYVVDGQDKKNARTSPSQFLRHTQSQKKKTALNQSNQMTQNPLLIVSCSTTHLLHSVCSRMLYLRIGMIQLFLSVNHIFIKMYWSISHLYCISSYWHLPMVIYNAQAPVPFALNTLNMFDKLIDFRKN